jgi:hypothetical protein
MKSAALLDTDLGPPLDGFTETPASAREAPKSAKRKKPVPFKVRWLNQIAGVRLPAMAVQAAILLADDYDDEKGYAWPSQVGLASRLNASRSGARLAIKCLQDAGYLEYVPVRGRGRPPKRGRADSNNRYFLRCPKPKNGH